MDPLVRRTPLSIPRARLRGVLSCLGAVSLVACQTAAPATVHQSPRPTPVVDEEVPQERQRPPSAEAYRAVLESYLLLDKGDAVGAKERIEEALLSDPGSAFLHTRLGEMRLAAGDIDGAGQAATAALKEDDRSVSALRLLATVRDLQADRRAAIKLFRRALAIAPGDRNASTDLAEIYLKEGNIDAAEAVIEALMEREPNATDGYVSLAQLFAERGELDHANRHLNAALERDARNLEALDLAKVIAETQGRFDVAKTYAQRIVRERGDSRSARHLLLRALLLDSQREEAATLVASWLLDDDSDEMLLLIADAMERGGDRDGAMTLLRDRRGRDAAPIVRAERGRLAFETHHYDEAATLLCDAATELDGDWQLFATSLCVRATAFRGDVEKAMGRTQEFLQRRMPPPRVLSSAVELATLRDDETYRSEVLSAIVRARDAEPNSNELLAMHVDALERLRDAQQARAVLDDAIRALPRDAQRKLLLARHLERQGDAIAAVAVVEALFATSAPTEDQLNFIAFTLADNSLRPQDAVQFAWRALVRAPTSGYVLDTLGWAQFRAGDLDSALAHLERADRFSGQESEILLHLAHVWHAKGDLARAKSYAQHALASLTPGDPIRTRVEALLITLDEDPA